jgi:hypothetical protein
LKTGCTACGIIIIVKMYAVYSASEPAFPGYLSGSAVVVPIESKAVTADRCYKVSTPSLEANAIGVFRSFV